MQRSAKVPSNFSDQVSVSVPSELIKRNLSAIYSDIKFFDGQPNPLNAFAYSESKIFKRLSHLPYSNIIQIIKEDLKKLSKKNSSYKSILYISDDLSFQDPLNKKGITSAVTSDFAFDILPSSFFIGTLPFLDSPDLINTTLVRNYQNLVSKYKIAVPILTRIFEYVHTKSNSSDLSAKPSEQKLLELNKKIDANFSENLRSDVQDDILNFWQLKLIIESFIKQNYNKYRSQFDGLISRVETTYLKSGRQKFNDEVNDVLIFNTIAESILPPELKNDHDAFDTAKALIYYLFEYCLFGTKTEIDDMRLPFPGPE